MFKPNLLPTFGPDFRITDNSAQRQVGPGQLGPEKSRPKTTRPKSSQFQKTTRPKSPQLLKTSRPMKIRQAPLNVLKMIGWWYFYCSVPDEEKAYADVLDQITEVHSLT